MPEHQGEGLRGIAERLSSVGLSLQEDTVRKAILTAFADAGHGPSVEGPGACPGPAPCIRARRLPHTCGG